MRPTDLTGRREDWEPGDPGTFQVVPEPAEAVRYDHPSVYVTATYDGGDPALHRLREVSVSFPVREGEPYSRYAEVVQAAIGEVARLADLPERFIKRVTVGDQPRDDS